MRGSARDRLPGQEQTEGGQVVEFAPPEVKQMAADPRWQLVERVAGSSSFRKAQRLREMLLYLTDRVLRSPGAAIHEQEIGQAVFGRSPDYDTSQDSLVRVHASNLRRRLAEYFSGEGAAEPIVLDLPPGSYAPVFRKRPVVLEQPLPEPPRRYRIAIIALAAAVVVLGILCAWLLQDRARLSRASLPAGMGPLVTRFWAQAHAGDNTPLVVLSDANMTLYQDLLGRRLSLQEYRGWHGISAGGQRLESPLASKTAGWALSHFFVPFNEVQAFNRIELAGLAVGVSPEVRFARLVTSDELASGSVVLLGNGRINPWVTAYDDRRQFRFGFVANPSSNKAYIENVSPAPGEQPEYVVDWQKTSYCVVAFLPNRNRTGNAVILEGAETGVTGAGAEFLTDETWMEELWQRLSPAGDEFPYFEVLLEAHLLERRAHSFSIVAHRVRP